jgi:peptidoglycan/xylan/chitin deacetylase (PgdA/CDA1 family)
LKPGKRIYVVIKTVLLLALLPFVIPFLVPDFGVAYNGVIYELFTREKVIALTFDDGPHPVYTPKILDILDEYKVKATFFMIGSRMEEYPEIVKEVSNRGHLIGNHTYTHHANLRIKSLTDVLAEVSRCQNSISRLSGQNSQLFRPPRGILSPAIITALQKQGYSIVLWSVSADHHDAPTPELMALRVIKHAHPGAIVLIHDGRTESRWKDVEATRLIIMYLAGQGYRFVTLEELDRQNL